MEESKKNIFIPSLSFVLALMGAITFSYWYYLGEQSDLTASIIFCLAFISSVIIMHKKRNGAGKGDIPGAMGKKISTIVIFSIAAVTLFSVTMYRISSYCTLNGQVQHISPPIKGKVIRVIERRYNDELILQLYSKNDTNGCSVLAYRSGDTALSVDDIIEINSEIRKIKISEGKYRNFSLSRIRQGVPYITHLGDNNFRIIQKGNPGIKDIARNWITENTNRLFHENTAAVLRALYFGNKSHIARRTLLSYKRAGVLHVLAASGLHVGILALIPLAILGLLRVNRKILMTATLALLSGYLFITDTPVSLQRAVIMFAVFTVQYILDMEKNIFNTLFWGAIIILLIYPYEMYNMGFQLSFGATTGILLFHRKCSDTFSFLPGKLKGPLSITLSAQIIVMPLILYHMGELNIAGFLSNIAVIPLTALMLILSIFVHAITPVSDFLALHGASAVDMTHRLCCYIIEFVSDINLHFHVSPTDYRIIIPFLLLMAPLYTFIKKKKVAPVMVCLSLLIFTILFRAGTPSNNVIVMSHSDGYLLLHLTAKKSTIIGTIPDFETADRISDDLEKLNIRNVTIYIPKPDYHNIRGFLQIVKRADVRQCVLADSFYFTGYIKGFFNILEHDKIDLKIKRFSRDHNNREDLKKIIDQKNNINIMSLYISLKQRAREDVINIIGLSGLTFKKI